MHLSVNQISKTFDSAKGKFLALDQVTMHVETGELVCVVGASGSGKSTLLRLIAGLDKPSEGNITVDGVKVLGPGRDRGMVFQKYTLYPWMTVAENVGFGLKLNGVKPFEQKQQVKYYLGVVGLERFAQSYPKELSGGMQQRVAIARALANQPKILLMDEPFGALDVQTKEVMQEFLLKLWRDTQTTILMITHDVEEAIFLAQRIYVLSANPGSVVKELEIALPLHSKKDPHGIKITSTFQDYRYEILQGLRQ
jgi:NitT/TauT family transport system ATP-binding protein